MLFNLNIKIFIISFINTIATEEFDELCFEFGIELEEDTTEECKELDKQGIENDGPQFKIDIPANRYDLLCVEGISRALNVFLGKKQPPVYKSSNIDENQRRVLKITGETNKIRPFAAAAILKGVKFNKNSYNSFIDLQDKLHSNLCRKRQFVAIGTHDYDSMCKEGEVTYEGRKRDEINFVPLNKTQVVNGNDILEFYKDDKHLNKYLHLISNSEVYPCMFDKNRTLLSLPPLINGDHSKIKMETTNVFIECTATDLTKLDMVLNIITSMFSEYTSTEFEIEQVKVINEKGESRLTPEIESRKMKARSSYINSCTGLQLSTSETRDYMKKMGLISEEINDGDYDIEVAIPMTRPDILHECDIMEDVAIAYGFNNLPRTFPKANTVGEPLRINKLSDIVRREISMGGWTEVLPLILCSKDENSLWMNKLEDDLKNAVHLSNPKTLEYQVVRTTLLPGLLKTIRENKHHALPIKVFETSDIVLVDEKNEKKATNERRVAGIYNDRKGSFEIAHGMLDRVLNMLGVKFLNVEERGKGVKGYYIKPSSNKTYFEGRAADIIYDDKVIGNLGILHPQVLEKFEIKNPCSGFEFNLEVFL